MRMSAVKRLLLMEAADERDNWMTNECEGEKTEINKKFTPRVDSLSFLPIIN